jgi:hypothetical protein
MPLTVSMSGNTVTDFPFWCHNHELNGSNINKKSNRTRWGLATGWIVLRILVESEILCTCPDQS